MGLRSKVSAFARGEVATNGLDAYASASNEAYDLLEQLPPEGPPRLCAWCAFVLQTHADNLVASGSTPGYCSQEAFAEASMLYQLAGDWIARAHTAQSKPGSPLDAVIPQPYPRPHGPQGERELMALRKTLETVQSRLGADLEARRSDPVYLRLQPKLPVVQAALDASAALLGGRSPGDELLATMYGTLLGALDRAFQSGELLAMTELLARQDAAPKPPPAPAVIGAAALRMFVPGDPGFDRWCLTDPEAHGLRKDDGVSPGLLDTFWSSDPDPATTLALQADIAAAVETGSADYMPNTGLGSLDDVAKRCPWPAIMFARNAITVGGESIDPGDQFVLVVGVDDGGVLHRALARISARAVADMHEQVEAPRERVPTRSYDYSLLNELADAGLDILIGDW